MKSVFEFNKSLLRYGFILCLVHLVTAFSWWDTSFTEPVCSPLFPNCESFSRMLLSYNKSYVLIYGLFSLITGILFLAARTRAAYAGFVIISIMKLVYHLSDYRFMGNYHYMAHVMNFVFLLAINKKQMLKLSLVLFYVGAGILKFNSDWLSGAVITGPFYFQGKLLEWAMAYVIVLELVFSWLLFSRHRGFKLFTLIQLYIFHALSYKVVGYFYPVIMSLFLLIFFFDSKDERPMVMRKRELGFVLLFVLAQLYSLVFFTDSALHGEGRILSLNMFDARSVCNTSMFLKYPGRTVEYNPRFNHLGVRIQCDPAVLSDHIRKTCKDQKKNSSFIDMDVNHQVKRISENHVPVNLSYSNVCAKYE